MTPKIVKTVEKVGGENKTTKVKKAKATKKPEKTEIRGMPVSGRFWKTKKEKFSSVKKSLYRRSLEQKMTLRNELKTIKEVSNSIKQQRKDENEEMKRRREQNAQRKLENERKSEIVQVIKNSAKIKRMKKKQLRKIEKRDLTNLKVV